MDSLSWGSVIRGHHIYKDIWTPFVGEILHVEQEARNLEEDRFAVAIVKVETIVCHVPHEVLRLLWHSFIQHDGTVSCKVTGLTQEAWYWFSLA